MKSVLSQVVIIVLLLSCNDAKKKEDNSAVEKPGIKDFQQIVIQEENITPTVDIKNFTLVSDNPEAYKADAKEIMKVKRNWPLAMQRKDSALFEEILAESFSFRAAYEFYPNKKSYIQNRVGSTWTIDTVRYENLVLQFLRPGMAVLTYKNKLVGTDSTGRPDIEYYVWADFYGKENTKWKITGSHEIDARIEYPKK